jgi:CubicO group peptidase (beta-lactamase class C family)
MHCQSMVATWRGSQRRNDHREDQKGASVASVRGQGRTVGAMADVEVHGFCPDKFASVRAAFVNNLASGADVGACYTAMLDGEVLVDMWGGHVDEAKTTPWEQDTIINVWSTTKTMTFLCALMLADAGQLSLEAPVAKYWPEFAANGKADVQVRHILSHSAGLSGIEEPITARDYEDWDKICSLLAAQKPWWEPGTASGYHAITQGYLIGEVIRRAIGQTLGTFFRTEVAEPLGADFHIGTPESADSRVALVIPPTTPLSMAGVPQDSVAYRTFANPVMAAEASHTVPWRRAEIPAAGGHGNARSVALVQSIMSGGGTRNGKRFLSEAGVMRAFEEQQYGTDLVLGMPVRFGMGYGMASDSMPLPPTTIYWGGWGGSLVLVDPTTKMTISYVMNKMGDGTMGDLRGASLAMATMMALAG